MSRNAHFLLGLQEAGVEFTAADMPHATSLTVGIMAMVAQKEREATSQRTKDALVGAAKRVAVTGQKKHPEIKRLGCPAGAAHLRKFGNGLAIDAIKAKAQERATGLAATIRDLKAEGIASANATAAALNERGYATPRGGKVDSAFRAERPGARLTPRRRCARARRRPFRQARNASDHCDGSAPSADPPRPKQTARAASRSG